MTDDPSSPSKKLVRETRTRNLVQFMHTRHTRILHEKHAQCSSRGYKIGQLWELIMRCCKNYSARTRCSDQKSLRNFLRMDVESFAQLIQKVAPLITRQETSMRDSRLAWHQTEHFNFPLPVHSVT